MKDTTKALFALVAVAVTIGYLWQTNRIIPSKEVSWNDVVPADQFLVRMAEGNRGANP